MAGDPKAGQKKNIAYTITAGFYPELASSIRWGGMLKGSKGATGAKYAQRKGFSDSSIRRIKSEAKHAGKKGYSKEGIPNAFRKPMPGQKKRLSFAGDMTTENPDYWMDSSEDGYAYVKRDKSTKSMGGFFSPGQFISKMFGRGTAFNEGDDREGYDPTGLMGEAAEANEKLEKVSYAKWMGGSELYKLYGTKVWYQEGMRDKSSLSKTIEMWGDAVESGNTGELPQNFLNQIYSRAEKKLIIAANEMAKEVFEKGLKGAELEIREQLKSEAAGESDVPEEEIIEARKGMKKGMKDYARKSDLKIDKRSRANKVDALTKTKSGADLYIDSTEMGITEDKGHGVISATEEVKRAVLNLKDGGDTGVIKKAVIDMFMKNISNDFNPIIRKLQQAANKVKGQRRGADAKKFKHMLKMVEDARKKAKADEKKMGYVVHMLANLGDGVGRNFRQGHRIATWPDGSKTYASVPMGIHPKTMLFFESGRKSPEGTTILRGQSHLLALARVNGAITADKEVSTGIAQYQAFARSRIHGNGQDNENMAQLDAQSNLKRKCHRTTTVSFAPDAMSDMIEKVMGLFYGDGKGGGKWHGRAITDALPNIKKDLASFVYSWPAKDLRNAKKNSINPSAQKFSKTGAIQGNKFWALPYIGINDNVYRGKGHGQK